MAKKWTSIGAAVTEEEKALIIKRAENSGMTTSEYVKVRLLIDQQDDVVKINNLDKWTVKSISYIAAYIDILASKSLSTEEYDSLPPKIADIIKRSGFLKDEEIFRNNSEQ